MTDARPADTAAGTKIGRRWLRRNPAIVIATAALVGTAGTLTAQIIDGQHEKECFSSVAAVSIAPQARFDAERVLAGSFDQQEVERLRSDLAQASATLQSYTTIRSCLDSSTARELGQVASLVTAALAVLQAAEAAPKPTPSAASS